MEQSKPRRNSDSRRNASRNQRHRSGKNFSRNKKHSPQGDQVATKGPKEKKLRIIPLGGMQEVGLNMTIFEYGDDIIILDMGLLFPEENMPGIDYIIPNTDYLKNKQKNIKAVVISHGHLDHIGAAPILLEQLGFPLVLGRPLTLAMIKHKQEDYKKNSVKRLRTSVIKGLQDVFKFGGFTIKFFQVDHSIMDAVGVIIETPDGTVIHPGDWTLEKDPQGKPKIDYTHLQKIQNKPTILMLESLGATDVRQSATDQEMKENLLKLISSDQGRVIVGTFASQIERIGWIIEQAEKLGKKVALDGYSMKMNIEIAKELGYIKAKKSTLIPIKDISKYDDKKLLILVTGAQGEGNAVLSRVINGSHKFITIKKSDTVILSSSIIPGNENTIQRLKDGLYRQTDNVIHGELMDIHVSGHGNREDIKYMLEQIKPDYYLPVYAYHYMLKEAANIGKSVGIDPKKIFVLDNGQVAEFTKKGGTQTDEKIPSNYVFVDGLGVGDVSHVVLRDRQMMAEDGMIVVIATIDKKKSTLVQNPDLISRGFIYMKENKKLIEQTRMKAKKIFQGNLKNEVDEQYFKDRIRNEIGEFLWQKTQRRPIVLPVIIQV